MRNQSGCIEWAALEILPTPLVLAKSGALRMFFETPMTPRYSLSDDSNYEFHNILKYNLVVTFTMNFHSILY